jgi:hypothetical protein
MFTKLSKIETKLDANQLNLRTSVINLSTYNMQGGLENNA